MPRKKTVKVNKPYCILSLDGGGTWALIQVKALLRLYGDISGHEVLKQFNLVAATSGGSIVLAGLVENMRLSELLASFQSRVWRQKIFVNLPWYDELPRLAGLGPRFSTEEKLKGLQNVFPLNGATPMPKIPAVVSKTVGCSPDFLITSFNYDRERVAFFRSKTNSRAASFSPTLQNATLLEAVHASTNAPINFFNIPAEIQVSNLRFWDGGVSGNNNPVLAAVTEALANQVPSETIRALSIGTGNVFLPIEDPLNNPANVGSPLVKAREDQGLVHDIKEIATTIIDDPPDAATFIAHVSLGGRLPQAPGNTIGDGPVIRMNPMVQPVLKDANYAPGTIVWMLPGQQQTPPNPDSLGMADFQKLLTLDIAVVEDDDVDTIARFCDKWLNDVVTNQPIRARSDTFAPEIGHGTFSQAQAAWLKCGC